VTSCEAVPQSNGIGLQRRQAVRLDNDPLMELSVRSILRPAGAPGRCKPSLDGRFRSVMLPKQFRDGQDCAGE